jgi:hypothetical protein
MYRKPHHKFLQNFPMVDISQVAMCISSQISERVTREGSFAKGFPMSSDLSRPFLSRKKSQWHWSSTCGSVKDSSTKFPEGLFVELLRLKFLWTVPLCQDPLGGIFCFFTPFFPICSPEFPKALRMFPIMPRFYPLCFARRSTLFNINYNPRLHIYF